MRKLNRLTSWPIALALCIGIFLFTACCEKRIVTNTSELGIAADADIAAELGSGVEEVYGEGKVKYDFIGIEKVINPEFLDALNSEEYVNVIVLLKDYKAFEGVIKSEDKGLAAMRQAEISTLQGNVLNKLDPKEFILRHRFDNILGFSGKATEKGVIALALMPDVELIEEDGVNEMHLGQGMVNTGETKIIKNILPGNNSTNRISLEEDRRINLPLPINLTILVVEDRIRLEWDPPEKYDGLPDIKYYNIYRGIGIGAPRLLYTTTNTFYVDKEVKLDNHFIYGISAVYQDGREGAINEVEFEGFEK